MLARRLPCVSFAALVVCVGSNAQAFAIQYRSSARDWMYTSDTVAVDLYIDAEPGLQLLSIGVHHRPDEAQHQKKARHRLRDPRDPRDTGCPGPPRLSPRPALVPRGPACWGPEAYLEV